MNKRFVVFVVIVLTISLSACGHFGRIHGLSTALVDNGTHANNTVQKLVEAISNQNVAGVKALFSSTSVNQVEDMDDQIKEMFSFIHGDIVVVSDANERGVGGGSETEFGKRRQYITISIRIETTTNVYFVAFRQTLTDAFDWNNIGVNSIYIINAKNWLDPMAYRGNGSWTPGINIEGDISAAMPVM